MSHIENVTGLLGPVQPHGAFGRIAVEAVDEYHIFAEVVILRGNAVPPLFHEGTAYLHLFTFLRVR